MLDDPTVTPVAQALYLAAYAVMWGILAYVVERNNRYKR